MQHTVPSTRCCLYTTKVTPKSHCHDYASDKVAVWLINKIECTHKLASNGHLSPKEKKNTRCATKPGVHANHFISPRTVCLMSEQTLQHHKVSKPTGKPTPISVLLLLLRVRCLSPYKRLCTVDLASERNGTESAGGAPKSLPCGRKATTA